MPSTRSAALFQLSGQLLEGLQRHKDQYPSEYPLTLRRLTEVANVTVAEDQIHKATAVEPFKSSAIVAAKKTLEAPVALREDRETLASSPILLEFALDRACSASAPLCPLKQLAGKAKLLTLLKDPFSEAVERQVRAGTLPPGVGGMVLSSGLLLYLERFPPPDTMKVAYRLLQSLRLEREAGRYPISLRQLLASEKLLPPGASEALQTLADLEDHPESPCKELLGALGTLGTAPLKEIVLPSLHLDVPVALLEDLPQLAASDALLLFLLEQHSMPEMWQWPVSLLAKLLAHAQLKRQFRAALVERLAANRWPEGVGVMLVRKKPHLYLLRLQPPPSPEEELAGLLLGALRARRADDGDRYPAALEQLAEDIGKSISPEQLRQIRLQPSFAEVVEAVPGNVSAPVVLREDLPLLARSPVLLRFLLRSADSSDNRAHTPADLKRRLAKSVQKPFEQAVAQQLSGEGLPEGVAALPIRRKPHLFLLEYLQLGKAVQPDDQAREVVQAAEELVEESAQADFTREFGRTFDRLDQQAGGHNFVSLVELRRALPLERTRFDAGLQRLRQAGLFTLSAMEGRHGITDEEAQAAIPEEGSLLLYVSRRDQPGQPWVELP